MGKDQIEWTRPETAQAVQETFLITDLDQVRVVADPIRIRILELLVVEPQPVKRLAAALGMPQTKLYYHINMLEEHGMIQIVGTRMVSGIMEKQYGTTAYSYRLDDGLLSLSAPGRDDTIAMMIASMFDSTRSDILRGVSTGLIDLRDDAPPESTITIGRSPMRLTPERAAELHQRLGDLIKEFCPNPEDRGKPIPGTQLYSLFVAYFPTQAADDADDATQ